MEYWRRSIFTSYYPIRGGYSTDGIICGAFCIFAGNSFSNTWWLYGAALSLLHIILFVVVVLSMIPFVVYSIFMFAVLLLMLTGPLALLYIIASYYALRGDSCYNSGLYCGCFMVHIGLNYDHGSWVHGAALDCFILCSSC